MLNNRIVGLDLLRSLIMLLSIPYHTALIFSDWVYSSPYHQEENIMLYAARFSHLFRMELFFCISGFFSILVIQNKGVDYFINSRIMKLCIPFFLIYLAYCLIYTMIGDFDKYNLYISFFNHFWFIYTLLFFVVFTLILAKFNFLNKINLKIFLLPVFLSFFTIFRDKDLYIFYDFLTYLPFYSLGILFFLYKGNIKVQYYFSLVIMIIILLVLKFLLKVSGDNYIYENMSLLIDMVIAYPIVILVFFLFKNLKNLKNNKFIRLMTESSLYIYIFHHPLVPFFSYIFDSKSINSYLLFFLISGSTFIVSMFLFLCFEKSNILRGLFSIRKI